MEIVQEMYEANTDPNYRVYVNQGGTSSAKTYTILQILLMLAVKEAKSVVTVVGQDLPNIKVGAWRDIKTIISDDGALMATTFANESNHTISFRNGALIEFKSYENEQDAKSGKRDYLFVNEANGINYDVYWQLAIRTKKKIWIDYNPSERFWVHDKVLGTDGVKLVISDFHFNPFLPADMAERIANIEDKELREVYTYGLTGKLEGLIIRDYSIVDKMPNILECKLRGIGLDFGFACFRGDTMIATYNGMKPICKVNENDFVLTSKGFKKVKRRIYNGRKIATHKRFIFGGREVDVVCTDDHLFKTDGKWKKYVQLTKEDNLFVLSSLTESSLNDIQEENIPITITTNGRKTGCDIPRCCIMRFTDSIMEKSRKVASSITKTAIRSIIALRILWRSIHRNTKRYTELSHDGTKNTPKNTQSDITLKPIGMTAGRKSSQDLQQKNGSANGAVLNTHQPTHTNDFAQSGVITDGNTRAQRTMSNGCAYNAESHFSQVNTRTRYVAQMDALIALQKPTDIVTLDHDYCDVWDLEVEGVHEYFANGILVHNCDPTAIVDCALAHGELWLDCFCYETGLTNPQIAKVIKTHQSWRLLQVVADSAEPKSIAEIKGEHINIVGAIKGNDSIRVGIDLMRRYHWNITRRSRGLIEEVGRYKWKTDRQGNTTNDPTDKWNHAIDAIRYWCLRNLAQRRENVSKAHSVEVG